MHPVAEFIPEEGRRRAVDAWIKAGRTKGNGLWGARWETSHGFLERVTSCPIGHALWSLGMRYIPVIGGGGALANAIRQPHNRAVIDQANDFIEKWDSFLITDLAEAFGIDEDDLHPTTAAEFVSSIAYPVELVVL